MTKKKPWNAFMYFAFSRRRFYELENDGRRLSIKELVACAVKDWERLPEDERLKWKRKSKGGQSSNQAISQEQQPRNTSNIFPSKQPRLLSQLERSLQPKPVSVRLRKSVRKELRQRIYQKLIWHENGNIIDELAQKRFAIMTALPHDFYKAREGHPAVEICVSWMSLNEGIIGSEWILMHNDYSLNNPVSCPAEFNTTQSHNINHLNAVSAYKHITNRIKDCWCNLIIVPLSEYRDVDSCLLWMSQNLANEFQDHLICMEDMIAVIGKMMETEVDDSEQWKQDISKNLHYACDGHRREREHCPVVVGKVACQHFLESIYQMTHSAYRNRTEKYFKELFLLSNNQMSRRQRNPFRVSPMNTVQHSNPRNDNAYNMNYTDSFSVTNVRDLNHTPPVILMKPWIFQRGGGRTIKPKLNTKKTSEA